MGGAYANYFRFPLLDVTPTTATVFYVL